MFLDFLGNIVSFSLFFRKNVGSCPLPPWKIFALAWKKSADAHEAKCLKTCKEKAGLRRLKLRKKGLKKGLKKVKLKGIGHYK
jgi:hypothetical protein